MEVEGDYTLEAPVSVVWDALLDPEVLASITPGCEKLELSDGQYVGDLNIKVGPIQGKFKGVVELQDIAEPESYTIHVDGKGAQGFVKAVGHVRLSPDGENTGLHYDADAKVGGRVASVGQRLLDATAKAIIKQSLEGLNGVVKAKAAGATADAAAEPPQVSQSQFAANVAKEVTKEMLPAAARVGLLAAAVLLIAFVLYLLVR